MIRNVTDTTPSPGAKKRPPLVAVPGWVTIAVALACAPMKRVL